MGGLGNKAILSRNLRALMEQNGKDRTQICDDLGFKYSTFNDWYNGNKYPRIDKIEMIANYFGVLKSDLIEDMPQAENSNLVSIRFCGPVAAHFSATPTALTEYMEVPRDWLGHRPESDFFLAVVDGHSMYPHYQDGDYILCLRCSDMGRSGRDGIITYGDDETTFKRIEFKHGENWIDLVPYNPEYKTNRIEGADLESCRIIGRVVRLIRKVDDV